MSILDDVRMAVEEIRKFPPLPIRVEMSRDVHDALLAALPPGIVQSTESLLPMFRGTPIYISPTLAPGEWSFVYRGR